jgi:uncharacterized protein YegL
MSTRRLPIYLLVDCSESMAGPAIEEVNRGIQQLTTTLLGNPLALETAYLSVITFSRYAKQVMPLTELGSFQPPKLSVRAGTAFGAALTLLLQCLQKEIVKTTPTTRGDYKPLVFLLTDGQPTDKWERAAAALKAANNPRIANIYAIGCGPDVDLDVLREITDIVLTVNDSMSADAWRKMFVWLSASVSSASTRLGSGDVTAPIEMPPLPEGVMGLASESTSYSYNSEPRQVFLQARCQRSRQPYLMRFALQGRSRYVAIASHKLEAIEDGDNDMLPPINSSMLDGCPTCPYCSNPGAAACSCGGVFCSGPDDPSIASIVVCPACNSQLSYGGSGPFDIQRSSG